jgi:UDP-N-acetylglucosamine--N-acetylmuramyl-(pentapeptide) pyrophosphoryl-undecaprenol N-acetylglucosamine transferase
MAEIWIGAGGTGGHIVPGLALADALESAGFPHEEIVFVTADRPLDRRLVPDGEYRIIRYEGRGLGGGVKGIARALAANAKGSVSLARPLRRARPAVVVGFGGYASFAALALGRQSGSSIVVVEENAVIGRTNRLAGSFADVIVGTYPLSLPPSLGAKLVMLGTPIRSVVKELAETSSPKDRARELLGVPATMRIVVIAGGSLGAQILNEAAMVIAAETAQFGESRVVVFSGTANAVSDALLTDEDVVRPGEVVRYLGYVARAYLWYAAADVVIARAGASTLAELCALGSPSIVIPFARAKDAHQLRNAEYLAQMGAGVLLLESEAVPERLGALVSELLSDESRTQRLTSHARAVARPSAARDLASICLGLINGG